MSELPERIRSAFERVPPVGVDEARDLSRRRRRRHRGLVGLGGAAAVVVIAALLVRLLPGGGSPTGVQVGPAGGGPTPATSPPSSQPPSSAAPGAVTASVQLSEGTVPAGGTLSAQVTVSNTTGSAVPVTGCGGIFAVLLTAGSYQPGPAWKLCAQRLSIPAGRSTYTVPVDATYPGCGTPGLPACTGTSPIPLPPGRYRARLFSQAPSVSVPVPAAVRVVGAAPPCRSGQVSVSVARQNPPNMNQPSDYIAISNVTARPCDIAGYPAVSVSTGQAPGSFRVVEQGSYEIRDPGPMTVQLRPGSRAYFGIGWVDANPPCTRLRSLAVTLPSDTRPVDVPVTISACAGTWGRWSLDVTAIAPASAFTGGAPPP